MLVDPSHDGAYMVHIRTTSKTASLFLLAIVFSEPFLFVKPLGMVAFTAYAAEYICIIAALCMCTFVTGAPVRGKWYMEPIPEVNYHRLMFYIETCMNVSMLCFVVRLFLFMYDK